MSADTKHTSFSSPGIIAIIKRVIVQAPSNVATIIKNLIAILSPQEA